MLRHDVPCNGCTLCCDHDMVRLEAQDDPSSYLTEPHPLIPGALMLAHQTNGACIYLTNGGCSIHDRAPFVCRIADCRGIAKRLSYDQAHRLHSIGKLDVRVWDQGRKLLEQEGRLP